MKVLVLISIFATFLIQAKDNYCFVEQGGSGKGTSTHYEAYCQNGQKFSASTSIFLSAFSKKRLQKKYKKLFDDLMNEASKLNLKVIAALKSSNEQGYSHIILSDRQSDDIKYCYGNSWYMSKISKKSSDRHYLFCNGKKILETDDLSVLKEYLVLKGFKEASSFQLEKEHRALHIFEKSKY